MPSSRSRRSSGTSGLALADLVLEGALTAASFVPNGTNQRTPAIRAVRKDERFPVTPRLERERMLRARVEVVAVRPKEWTPKRPRPKWTHELARELTWSMRDEGQEKMVAFLLDEKERLIGIYEHTIGGTGKTAVYPEHILKMALLVGASGLALAHNHPTGSSEPSDDDRTTTRRMRGQLAPYGVALLYHYMVGADDGLDLLDARPQFIDHDQLHDWHLPPPAVVEAPTNALVSPPVRATRVSFEPYGKHSAWLVKSGLVRPALTDLASDMGTFPGSVDKAKDFVRGLFATDPV